VKGGASIWEKVRVKHLPAEWVSDKMDKTRVAAVVRTTRHPSMGKLSGEQKNISFTTSITKAGWATW